MKINIFLLSVIVLIITACTNCKTNSSYITLSKIKPYIEIDTQILIDKFIEDSNLMDNQLKGKNILLKGEISAKHRSRYITIYDGTYVLFGNFNYYKPYISCYFNDKSIYDELIEGEYIEITGKYNGYSYSKNIDRWIIDIEDCKIIINE